MLTVIRLRILPAGQHLSPGQPSMSADTAARAGRQHRIIIIFGSAVRTFGQVPSVLTGGHQRSGLFWAQRSAAAAHSPAGDCCSLCAMQWDPRSSRPQLRHQTIRSPESGPQSQQGSKAGLLEPAYQVLCGCAGLAMWLGQAGSHMGDPGLQAADVVVQLAELLQHERTGVSLLQPGRACPVAAEQQPVSAAACPLAPQLAAGCSCWLSALPAGQGTQDTMRRAGWPCC